MKEFTRIMVCVLSLALAWGVSGTCLADNAASINIQVSYPSGKNYVSFYNGGVGDIDTTKKDNYVNVHITLLDASGNPATAGPTGEDFGILTATLTTELGVTGSIVEDEFLTDSATLNFDVVDVGGAARAHVRYACTSSCEPGTDTLEVTVDSLTASAEVEVRPPEADSLVVRTLRIPGVRPTELFDTITGQSNNAGLPALAGDDIYFEVWAAEENGEFTTAPELDGQVVTITAYGDYDGNNTLGNLTIEREEIASTTATINEGVATGYITIEKAGTYENAGGSESLRVVLTAEIEDGVHTSLLTGAPISTTAASVDRVSMKPRIKSKLIIGTDPSGQGNLIEEKNVWYVLDDNASGPTTNAMAVFVADEYGNPVKDTVQVKSAVSGPLVDDGKTLMDLNGANGGSGDAWDITNAVRSDTAKDGLATVVAGSDNTQEATGGGGGSANRGAPLQATLTLDDEGLQLDSDAATVYLVRMDNAAPLSLDLHLDTDKSNTEVTAGDTVTLYITSASGSSSNPTTSEIVEYNDDLTIDVFECTGNKSLMISKSTQDFAQSTSMGLSLKAPIPTTGTKEIKIPIKVYSGFTKDAVRSVCVELADSTKGLEDIPIYSLPGGAIVDMLPSDEDQVVISALPSGVKAQDSDLDAEPVVITSDFLVGDNTLLTPASVDTADAYGNISNDTPTYGISSDVGVATVDGTRAATITFEEGDVGETATVTVTVPGVGSRHLSITSIVESTVAGAITCTVEGPPLPAPGGEAIVQVKANKTFSPSPKSVRVSIDEDNSVTDSELRDFTGTTLGTSTDDNLDSGSMLRLVVSAPETGMVTLVAGDLSADPFDTGTCEVHFAIDTENPVAAIAANNTNDPPTAEIVITVTDNVGVNLETTDYTVEKDATDITGDLECVAADDRTTEGTITCSKSGGGLDVGDYTVEVTPKDLAGNTGDTVTSDFTVAECIPVVTIDPTSAGPIFGGDTVQFSASTACDSTDVTSEAVYTWEISEQGCTGSNVDSDGLYTAPASPAANCTDKVKVTDTAHGNASAEATVEVIVCTPSVTVTPSSVTLDVGDTQQFSATTKCDSTTLTGTYTWTVDNGTVGSINSSGLFTALAPGTAKVTATDTANQNKTGTATVTVKSPIVITPDPMLRSRWILLPVLMTIKGDGTNFAIFSTTVTFDPSTAVLPLLPLILGPEDIWQMIFVNPSWLAGVEDDTMTVTVTTGAEVVSGDVQIQMLPFPLDQEKALK